jgi:predicted transcriptional regulator
MRTHEEMKAIALSNPAVRAEYDRINREEMPMLDAILKARKEACLTQAQIAERMGTSIPAVSRLENALITGKPSPSLATLKRYAAAMGKTVNISFV